MDAVKLSLVNNDHKVVLDSDLSREAFLEFVRGMREELVTGETATLEIVCQEGANLTFEVAHSA